MIDSLLVLGKSGIYNYGRYTVLYITYLAVALD